MTLAFAASARGCFCFSTPMSAQTDLDLKDHAVFAGRVVEVWPNRETIARETGDLSLKRLRPLILARWGSVMTPKERRSLRWARRPGRIGFHYAFLQRVRFEVDEVLLGPAVAEVFTEAASCGYRFEVGREYLVNADRQGGHYRTGACSRTGPLSDRETVEDLDVLRARKARGGPDPR